MPDSSTCARRASLSSKGFELTRNVMRLNETLAELADDHVFLGEWVHFITAWARPRQPNRGVGLSGHHTIVNYFVLGDQLVITPLFLGFEPVRATSGQIQGAGDAAKGSKRRFGNAMGSRPKNASNISGFLRL
jgi:hypothetical protein